MSRREQLCQWVKTVSTNLPSLTKPQALVVALYSFGIVIAQTCGLTAVAAVIAKTLGKKEDTAREQLRDLYREKQQKKGKYRDHHKGEDRQQIDVTVCFTDLVKWVLTLWPPEERRVALAMDASTLTNRFTVLSIHILYRSGAIPIAWVVLPACAKGAWKPHWGRMFNLLRNAFPRDWDVVVMADSGLYSRSLYRTFVKFGWHPFLRITQNGNVRPNGNHAFQPLAKLVPTRGSWWVGGVTCFSTTEAQLKCTLLARWDEECAEPWLVVTDLAPEACNVAWYGMRSWIEAGYKDGKRGGWHWEQTKMEEPSRATRLWLAMAVATLWVMSVGSAEEDTLPVSNLDALPETHVARRYERASERERQLSCFRRGVLAITLAAGGDDEALPMGYLKPEPWEEAGQHDKPRRKARRKKEPTAQDWFLLIALVAAAKFLAEYTSFRVRFLETLQTG